MPKAFLDKTIAIPRSSSSVQEYELNDYSRGMNSYISNDPMPVVDEGANFWRLAQDARITTLGEYETRKGFDFHSDAAGETLDQSQTSVTGAADQSLNTTTWLAQRFTAGTTGKLSKLEVRLNNTASATGTVLVALYTDVSSSPGTLISKSSISASSITSSYAYLTARFIDAPSLTATLSLIHI